MSAEKLMGNAPDSAGKGLYRTGGISALLLGLGYVVTIPLYASAGGIPNGEGGTWLTYLAGKTTVWWMILALSVFTDLLFVPVALALYLALKGVSRNAMLVGTAFVGLFVVLDLAVTWPNFASLIALGGKYAAATSDAQRTAYVAAADYASAVLGSRLEAVYSIAVLSMGILLIGLVMRKAIFGKITAYTGVVTGLLGIVSVVGSFFASAASVGIILNAVLTTIWVLLVGYRLYRLG